MDRISNLCKILLTSLLFTGCHPVFAQEETIPNGVVMPKFVNVACGNLKGLISYLNETDHQMVFMGATLTEGIFDSLWINRDKKEYIMVRATHRTGEGCMLSNGLTVHSDYFAGQAL